MVRRNDRTLRQQYAPHLRRFMSWKDSHPYADGTEFTDAQLLEIRPNHLLRYMSLIAYGPETPGDNDRPTQRHSSGHAFVKKAISFFMPNQNAQWNVEHQSGNPTMSLCCSQPAHQKDQEG